MKHAALTAVLLFLIPVALPGQHVADLQVGIHPAPPEVRAVPDRGMTGQRQMSAITKGMVIGGGIGLGAGLAVALAFAASSDGGDLYLPFALVPAAVGALVGAAIGAGFEAPSNSGSP